MIELKISNFAVVEELQQKLKQEVLQHIDNDVLWETEYDENDRILFITPFKNGKIIIWEDSINFHKNGDVLFFGFFNKVHDLYHALKQLSFKKKFFED